MKHVPLCLVLYLYISFAYDLSCPDPSQVHLRRKVCNNGTDEDSKYACLVDTNKNNSFRESCEEEPSFVRPGRKYIFSGSSTDGSCNSNRYQPIPFAKAMYSMCILLKSTCNELGQVLSSNTSATEDSTCRCDHGTGYTYVSEPKNIFKCISSEEDCTCYRKQCPSNGCLSSDYKCIEANNTHCSSFIDTSLSPRSESIPTTTTVEITTQLKDQIVLYYAKYVSVPTSLLFIYALTVIIIVYRTSIRDFEEDGEHLYMKIIGHWKLLKENMSLSDLNTLLTKEDLTSQPEIDKHKQKSLNWQKDFCLIKVLKATEQEKYVNKCTKIITAQRQLDEILRRPMQVPKWHKRGIEICRKQIQDNKLLLKEMFNPVLVMDDFMQSFIFGVDQYEDITSPDVIENTLETFLKELDKTLNRGSFECLLTSLEKSKEPILSRVLEVLKTGLVQASMTSGTILNGLEDQGSHNTQKVLLCIKPVTTHIPECVFQDQVMKYCTYFIEEFGLHLESDSSLPDIWLYPIVTDVEKRLRRGIQNGALSRLLENLFTATSDKWSEQGILCVNVIITFITNNSKDNLIELSRIQTSSMHNIVASNKSLIESELDCDEFVDSLVKKGFKDFERVRNDDEQFFKLLEDKVDDKTFLKMFLKIAEDTMSVAAFKKLQTYNKVWSADSTIIPDKILENVSALGEIWTELQDFKEICIERNILSAAFFEEIEKKISEDQQFIEILVHIVQFGNRDAALALVETLYNNGHDLLASDILFMDNRIDTEKEVAREHIIVVNTQVEDEPNTVTDRSFFEGDYSLQWLIMVAFADGTNQADFLMDSEVSSPKRRKISDTTGSVQSENTCDDSPSDIEGRANGHTESDDSQNSVTAHVEQSNTTNCSTSQTAGGNNEDFKESVLRDCVSAREKIYRNWKNLKEAFSHITPRKLLNIMSEHKLVSVDHIPDVNKMSKSLALDCILIACTRQVFDQDTFEKFKQVTAEINSNKIIVWEAQVENPAKTEDYNINDEKKTRLKQILKKEHFIKIKDDFLQQLIFSLTDQEKVVQDLLKNEKSEHFFMTIFEEEKISKGSIACLVNCLCELQEGYRPIELFLKDLKRSPRQDETTKDSKMIDCIEIKSHIQKSSHGLAERLKIELTLEHNGDEKKVDNALEQGVNNAALDFQRMYGSYVERTEPGCLEIYLSSIHGDVKNDLTSSLINGAYLNLLKKIINVEEMKKLLCPGKYKLTTRIVTLQGTSQPNLYEDVQVVKHLISANRSFLIDEIDAEYLIDVFDSKGIQLPGISELKVGDCREQAEHFLKAIETNGLEEILLEVLKKEGMTYIYDRLQTFINVYAYKDLSSLRKQFKKQFLTLVTAVDLDDVQPIFVDRNIFTTQLFETLEKKYKDKREEGMAQFLVEILKSGPLAMLTFVDSLYICHLTELANSLLEPTENIKGEYQEMVESSSDHHTEGEECLFEGIFELIVRETDTAENSRIVPPTVGLSLTTTLSGEKYKLETIPQNEDNVIQHKPYELGQSIFHLRHQFDLTSVITDKWINVTCGVMMDDGRLVLCLIYMEILICNTDGSKTDNIQLMCQPKSITAINSFTVAVMSVESDYIEMLDINNKHKINSIQLHKGWGRGITTINNKLVVHSYGELYIMDHQTGEIVQTMSVVQEYNSASHIPCVHATGDRIFYNDGHTKKLYCYNCTDKKESTTTLPSIPEKITSLQDGSLYVVCKDVPVQHVSSDGKHYNRVTTNELKSVKDYNVFSYNQKQRKLVTCTSDGTVQVFNDK